jgi:8-oxo-dGTP pyrophosphatase MutT (NUDIX family)
MQKTTETAAGGVLFRRGRNGPEVVVGEQRDRLTGARTLRLPKGKLERRESLEQAALREVREETGLAGRIVAALGCVDYTYSDAGSVVAKTVHFFLMEWEPGAVETPDGELARIAWLPIEEARRDLTYATERAMLERAVEQLARREPA